MLRASVCVLLLVSAAVVPGSRASAASRVQPGAACALAEREDQVISVTEAGEVELASGAVAKLAGIRLPEDPARRGAALIRLQALVGRPVRVGASGAPDRWGRLEAEVEAAGEPGSVLLVSIAQDLVARGLALVDAGTAEILCRPDLLGLEASARRSRLGVWSDERYNPLAARAPAGWRERIGAFVLVEGRVWSVGERRWRTYLNFGPDRAEAVTITVPKPTWTMMAARGLTAASFRGRRVRARGILEDWGGPVLEITAMDVIEVLDQDDRRR